MDKMNKIIKIYWFEIALIYFNFVQYEIEIYKKILKDLFLHTL